LSISRAGRSSIPLCPCGVHEVAELSEGMRRDRAALKGTCWDFAGNGPWFFFRQACHVRLWKGENRPPVGNRWWPEPEQHRAVWQKRGSVARLVSPGSWLQNAFLFARAGAQAATDVEMRAFPWRCPRKLAPVLVFFGNRWQFLGIWCENGNVYSCFLLGAGARRCIFWATAAEVQLVQDFFGNHFL